MAAVTLSAGVRSALTSLQGTTALANATQNRLATGKKVNSALDNPGSFFISQGLSARANDLSRLLDDQTQATKVLETADKGITSITKLVESATATLRQAQQSAATNLSVEGTADLSAYTAVAGDAGDLDLLVDGVASSITIAADDTADTILADLNAIEGVKASLNADGKLVIEATGGASLEIDSGSTAATLTALGLTAGAVARTDDNSNATRTSLASQFDSLRTQISQLAGDASYNGTNLLGGDSLTVTFNESGTSTLGITGVSFDAAGLGVSAAAGNLQSDADIQAAIDELGAATTTLRAQASTFGANLSVVNNRQDFTKGLVATLTAGSDALVLADLNEEGANLLALNTRQQLSQTALSLASQADSAVLRLFG